MATIPALDPVSQIQATDVIMITHADGTTEKITGENFMKAMAVDVIAENNMNSVTSNAVAKVVQNLIGGQATLDPNYVTRGSLSWVKIGKLVILNITNVELANWNDGDKVLARGLPRAETPVWGSINALNSTLAQLFSIQSNGDFMANGGMSISGDFYGSFCYFTKD